METSYNTKAKSDIAFQNIAQVPSSSQGVGEEQKLAFTSHIPEERTESDNLSPGVINSGNIAPT